MDNKVTRHPVMGRLVTFNWGLIKVLVIHDVSVLFRRHVRKPA